MPKRIVLPKIGSDPAHRKALLRNLVTQLFKHERIQTTFAKAMSCRLVADEMITYGKKATPNAYRSASAFIYEKPMLRKCFTELAERYKFRPGGFTRIVRCQRRRHDNAEMAYIELVDRQGEFRSARAVDYPYAVSKGLVPPPLSPIETPEDLAIASAISPSTSNKVTVNRCHFLKGYVPDHLKYYPKFTRKTVNLPAYLTPEKVVAKKVGIQIGDNVLL